MSKADHALITSDAKSLLDPELFDIRTAYDLIQALGGVAAVAEDYDVLPSQAKEWSRSGNIPPGWHLGMFGDAALLGKTVAPQVFGFTAEHRKAQGLALLAEAHRRFLQVQQLRPQSAI